MPRKMRKGNIQSKLANIYCVASVRYIIKLSLRVKSSNLIHVESPWLGCVWETTYQHLSASLSKINKKHFLKRCHKFSCIPFREISLCI